MVANSKSLAYDDIAAWVELHGGEVGPQSKNPFLDHVWSIRANHESLCGQNPGPDYGLNPAGKLCMSCKRIVENIMARAAFQAQ